MKTYESDCVGCETCYGYCSKREPYPVYSCDKCGNTGTVYEYKGKDYCWHCLSGMIGSDGGKCEICGTEVDVLYDGCCEDCFFEGCDRIAETVR